MFSNFTEYSRRFKIIPIQFHLNLFKQKWCITCQTEDMELKRTTGP